MLIVLFVLLLFILVFVEMKWHIFKNFGGGLGKSNAKKFGMNYTDKDEKE